VAQINWLGLRVSSQLTLFYSHQMNWVNVELNFHSDCCDDSTINVILGAGIVGVL